MTREKSTPAYRELNGALFKLTVKPTLSSGEKWPRPGVFFHRVQGSGRRPLLATLPLCLHAPARLAAPQDTGAVT